MSSTTTTEKKILDIQADQFFVFLKNEKLVLIDFFADWCPPCKSQGELLEAKQSELYKQYPDLKIVKLDTDKDGGISTALGIQYIPNLVAIYKQRIGMMKSGVRQIGDISKFLANFMKDTDKMSDIPPDQQVDTLASNVQKTEDKESKKPEKKKKK